MSELSLILSVSVSKLVFCKNFLVCSPLFDESRGCVLINKNNTKEFPRALTASMLQVIYFFVGWKRAFSMLIPEALMRSRYSVYTIADISYIKSTMKGKASENYDEVAAGEWARSVRWLDVTVMKSSIEDDHKGFVEFVARYEHDRNFQTIHENSEFHKVNGLWYYIDGTLYPDNQRSE